MISLKILQNRKFSIAVFILVVIVFTLLGSHRSLSRLSAQVEEAFFRKELLAQRREELLDAQSRGFDGPGEPSLVMEGYYSAPASQLEDCADYANRILALIKDDVSEDIYNSIYESRRALVTALESRDISDIYDAHSALYESILALDGNTVTNNFDDFDSAQLDFLNASSLAEESGYNQCVDYFMLTEMDRFPTNVLRHLTSVDMPEKYE